jgi:hydrogenase maturation protease
MHTLLLGLGNPILSDDAIGVRAAEAVQAALPQDAKVDVEEACVGGLSLMERMVGYDRAILIDALCLGEAPVGTVRRLSMQTLTELSPTQHSASAHDTNLATALATGRRMGLALPQSVVIFAVEVENVLDFGEELTPAVAQALPEVTAAVLAELGYGVPHPAFTPLA